MFFCLFACLFAYSRELWELGGSSFQDVFVWPLKRIYLRTKSVPQLENVKYCPASPWDPNLFLVQNFRKRRINLLPHMPLLFSDCKCLLSQTAGYESSHCRKYLFIGFSSILIGSEPCCSPYLWTLNMPTYWTEGGVSSSCATWNWLSKKDTTNYSPHCHFAWKNDAYTDFGFSKSVVEGNWNNIGMVTIWGVSGVYLR